MSGLKIILESYARVDDRRHGACVVHAVAETLVLGSKNVVFCIAWSVCFLPVAIFVRDLRDQVVLRLKQQHLEGLAAVSVKIPSENMILYPFSPKHPLYAASLHYTCKANVKNKVQLRTLRAHHIDSHYCAALKKYMKHMGVRAATLIEAHTHEDQEPACVSFYSLDDKAKVCD